MLHLVIVGGGSSERKAGDVLEGRYRLLARVGQGGFGDVWRAAELLPDGEVLREVALKLLHAGLTAEHDWSAEARIIASLRHEALVTIYAAGVLQLDQPVPFVAMELLLGESLAERIERDETVSWRRVLAWAREAAAALDVIHLAGVVHLDLKPANLFLNEQGALKVLDFGIAQQGQHRATVPAAAPLAVDDMSTAAFMVAQDALVNDAAAPAGGVDVTGMSQAVVGTPGFMAPEIFEGGEATHAADAYALAACIVQLVCGCLPQQIEARPTTDAGTSMQAWLSEVQSATVRGRLRDLAVDHPGVPAALMALLLRWLALDPLARKVDRGQLRAQLDQVWQRPYGVRDNPFAGLRAYGSRDEGALFGCDDEARRGARDLYDQPCSVLHGPLGAGLGSLVAAGVVPALAKAFADQRDDWSSLLLRPSLGEQGVRQRLSDWLDERGAAAADDAEGEQDDDAPLQRLVAWAEHADEGVVLVVTELNSAAVGDTAALFSELVETVLATPAGLRLVGTLREEHVSQFLETKLGERLRPWLRYVSPPAASAARDIVNGPLLARGKEVASAARIAERCQAELFADGARLPLVSLALRDWFAFAEKHNDWELAVWQERGGVVGALCRHADTVLGAFDDGDKVVAKRILLRLVSADGSPLSVRREVLIGEDENVRKVLSTLCQAHLVLSQDNNVQLSHPQLAEQWSWLVDERLQHLEQLTFLEQLRGASAQWLSGGYQTADLWDAQRLRAYQRRADVSRELNHDERLFVQASLAKRRRGRWLRALAGALLALALVAAIGFDHSLDERNRRQRERMAATERNAALASMVARARRTNDPYIRTALLAGAIEQGLQDPALPLELLRGVADLVPAEFLTLDEVHRPHFAWGERWLIGVAGAEVLVFDFQPPGGADFAPAIHRFQPHHGGIVDVVSMAFDSAFVTRGLDGRLKVWRLREDDGGVALAAVSPMLCAVGSSQILLARRAAVIACASDEGMVRWNLATPGKVKRDPFTGRLLELSPDGRWLIAARLDRVLLWDTARARRIEIRLAEAPNIARFSPRDEVVAFLHGGGFGGGFEVFDVSADKPRKLMAADFYNLEGDPVAARFSADGVHLAVCRHDGFGEWHYLRKGARPADDAHPAKDEAPCRDGGDGWPRGLSDIRAYGEHISGHRLGPRLYDGGWQLKDGTTVTRDLVRFSAASDARAALTQVAAKPQQTMQGESVTALLRSGSESVWQLGDALRIHSRDGAELLRRKGYLLARCPDGRLLARRKTAQGEIELFGARSDTKLRRFKAMAGFILGVDPDCQRLFAQRLDGTLVSGVVAGDWAKVEALTPLEVAGGGYVLDGYAYDARPSSGSANRKAGLWLAFGSGAMVRVDADAAVTAYGSATPRASAMADGPDDHSLLFADETGVVVRRLDRPDRHVLPRDRGRSWEDLLMSTDPRYSWISWAHGVALLDLDRGELLDEVKLPHHGRLSRWSQDGAVASWSRMFMGPPRATLIPVGIAAAKSLGAGVSNLRATLSDDNQNIVMSLHGR